MYVKKRRVILFALVGLAVGLSVALAVVNNSVIAAKLHHWKLLPEPERLTELYFTDHTKLPASFTPGQPQSLMFTVHNLEGRTTSYRYKAEELVPGNQPLLLGVGSFILRDADYRDQAIALTPTDAARTEVRITLQPGGEVINHWMDRR